MHAIHIQDLLFEFYALLDLARITLDELRHYVQPLFATQPMNMPKSIKKPPRTDELPDLHGAGRGSGHALPHRSARLPRALPDVRDLRDDGRGADRDPRGEIANVTDRWSRPFTRTVYRVAKPEKVVVNVLLPDQIYESAGNDPGRRLVRPYTYDAAVNMLTQSVEFLGLGAAAVSASLQLLLDTDGVPFTWKRR